MSKGVVATDEIKSIIKTKDGRML